MIDATIHRCDTLPTWWVDIYYNIKTQEWRYCIDSDQSDAITFCPYCGTKLEYNGPIDIQPSDTVPMLESSNDESSAERTSLRSSMMDGFQYNPQGARLFNQVLNAVGDRVYPVAINNPKTDSPSDN
jgi:hypothetical protein